MNSRSRVFVWLGILCFCISAGFAARVGASPAATAPAARKQKLVPYAQYLDERVVAVLDRLEKDQDYPAASLALQSLFDQAILFAPSQRVDCIREADFARRLVDQLSDVPPEARDPLLPFLRKHEALAQTMAFLLRPGKERIAAAYDLLNRFRQERPDQLDDFSSLVAALCAVQYQPVEEDINENHVKAADPIDIFDYYVRNESRMFFGIRNVPAELLVHVVDTTASIPEMEWALGKYAGTQDVGGLFFTISYDYQYLQRGTQKQLTVNGFNLPNNFNMVESASIRLTSPPRLASPSVFRRRSTTERPGKRLTRGSGSSSSTAGMASGISTAAATPNFRACAEARETRRRARTFPIATSRF